MSRFPASLHIFPSASSILTSDADNAEREVDEVDKEDESSGYQDGVVEEGLAEHHTDSRDTGGELECHELHQMVLVGASLGNGHDDILKTVIEKNHISSLFCLIRGLDVGAESDLSFLKHEHIVLSGANSAHSSDGSKLERL